METLCRMINLDRAVRTAISVIVCAAAVIPIKTLELNFGYFNYRARKYWKFFRTDAASNCIEMSWNLSFDQNDLIEISLEHRKYKYTKSIQWTANKSHFRQLSKGISNKCTRKLVNFHWTHFMCNGQMEKQYFFIYLRYCLRIIDWHSRKWGKKKIHVSCKLISNSISLSLSFIFSYLRFINDHALLNYFNYFLFAFFLLDTNL
jgi:hypothetical protein